ncbi:type VI secretion system tip protein VgrG [Trinickia sp. LjRoot230]|uniref:type VI secretion system Vgr family protein n=1 Tax=Trinickia sp. LjRoot230 TaxID=3342288 RepID=UPI003ECFC818
MSTYFDDIVASRCIPGRQSYFVDVPGVESADELSAVSFRIVERIGEPWRITAELTHPDALLRADYLGKHATFALIPERNEPRAFHGCITAFSKLRTTKDLSTYRFVIEAHASRLRLTSASRIFQHQSAPQIIEAILRRHEFKGHQFAFKLRRVYPEHAFRLQYALSDWDYLRVLMEQEGIYCYFMPAEHGDILVFADDIDHYLYQPTLTLPYREPAGLETSDDAILSLHTHATTVAQSFVVADYNPDQAWERVKADANVASKDETTYGQPYVYGTGHLDQTQAKWEAQLRHEAAICWQVVYDGESTHADLRCARIVHTDDDLPDAPNGMVIVEVIHTGARDKGYRNAFKAIPADRRFRLPINETSWPRIHGTLSARVTSPSKYKYAYVTKAGFYVVRFDLDFDAWNPGGESVPLRLAKPFAGKLQTGMHFPALDGDEAVIEFRDGDPNKPYIAAFHHHSQATDLITNQDRWMSRNVIRTQSDNKLEMEDWEGQEHVKLSTEHSGKSQLTLGHMVDGQRQKRGEGFELRTSGKGAVRAGGGLFMTTYDRPGAKGMQLDMQEAIDQLGASHARLDSLAAAAAQAQADAADVKAINDILQNQLVDLQQQVMLLSARASIAFTTPDAIQHNAGRSLTFTAGENADVGVTRKFTVAAGERISLFAQKLGMKLFAARGKIEVQAQSDAMALAADKDLTITSANGKVHIAAKNELLLMCGGSYLRLTSTGIEDGTRGEREFKAASFGRQGPNTVYASIPDLPHSQLGPFSQKLSFRDINNGVSLKDVQYKLFTEGEAAGEVRVAQRAVSVASGSARAEDQNTCTAMTALFGHGQWAVLNELDIDRDPILRSFEIAMDTDDEPENA